MRAKSKDIILLLGAGASVEAGVPSSPIMINDIERLLKTPEWNGFEKLYHQIKSAIYYKEGIKGRFNSDISHNIETLVNTLTELERSEDHPIYPFIATWNSRLVAFAGHDFQHLRAFLTGQGASTERVDENLARRARRVLHQKMPWHADPPDRQAGSLPHRHV